MNQFKPQRIAAISLVALAILIHLTACATLERHPGVSAFIAGSLVLTAGGALRGHDRGDDRHIDTPSVNCDSGACR